MRTAVLAVFGLVVAAPLAHGQESTGWAAKLLRTDDGKVPTGHDFGVVPKGAVLRHRFPVTNIYAVPLQVVIGVSCTCVTATCTPQVLQPRDTGALDIAMDTTRFNGFKSVTLYLTVMSPDQRFSSTSSLTIQGNCRLEVQLDPGQAAFGVVPAGTPVAREVRVHRTGAPTWEVSGPAANESAPFDVRVVPEVRQGGRVSYRVQLALKPDTPAGTYRGDLNLLTNDPNNRTVPIPYDVTVQAPLTVAPDPSRFGTIAVGQAATRRVSVRAGRPFHILAVEGQADGVSVELPATAAASPVHTLTIKFQPTQPGPVQRTLTIKTDLDGGAAVTARVEATVRPAE